MTLPAQMRAAVITAHGAPDVLRLEFRPLPVPAGGEVLVRVHASAMNRADVLQRQGRYPPPPGAPADIPGLELAGTVVGTGGTARRWREGDRVFGLVPGGAHAEFALAHENTLAAIPAALSWTEAGAIPEGFITAYDALEQAAVRRGERVLIHAVASGVGLAAVQLARARGAVPFGTTRSADKLDVARRVGLEAALVVASSGAIPAWIMGQTAGHGANVVLDLVGGDYVAASLLSLAPRGRLMLIGTMGGADTPVPLGVILRQRITIRGTVLRSRALEEREHDTAAFARDVVPLFAAGRARPVIDTVLPLDRIIDAHRRVESNRTAGKVVIRMTEEER